MNEFISQWKFTIKPGFVTLDEFIEYHKVINALYNDEQFNYFIENGWKI